MSFISASDSFQTDSKFSHEKKFLEAEVFDMIRIHQAVSIWNSLHINAFEDKIRYEKYCGVPIKFQL